jgi:transposase
MAAIFIMIAAMLFQDFKGQGTPFEQLQAAYLSIQLDKIKKENSHLLAQHQQDVIEITSLKEENARLKEQLQLAQQRHFGNKRDVGESSVSDSAEGERQTVAGYTRKKKNNKSCGRIIDLSKLPQHIIEHDLNEANKICHGCNHPLHLIEKERAAGQLEILPQRFYCAVHVRYKYGCHPCQTIHMAPKIPAPIPKALAGASVLTEVLINKYQYHLPLYRQSKMMSSLSVIIPDNTLGNWVMQIGSSLMMLYDACWQAILTSRYLQVDETPVKVLKPEKKGYLWTYYAPWIGKGLIVFELSLTRSGIVAEKRLASFKGLLQTDGYNGYQGLRKRDDIEGLGCITHARRKFSEVLKITKNPDSIASLAIARLKPLYELEERMREREYSFHTRKRLRQKIAWPILKDFHAWLKKTLPHVPPKSQLANAISYSLNQWPYLIKYLRHGMAEIDTNWVEGEIRNIALGKKNWMFIGNEDSGKVHSLFYSLVLSAILNGLNPRLYLHYLITKVHDLRRGLIDPMSLLPHMIDQTVLKKFADELLADAKKILDSF